MVEPRRYRGFLLTKADGPIDLAYTSLVCDIESICLTVERMAAEYGVSSGAFTFPVNTGTAISVFLQDQKAYFGIFDGNNILLDADIKDIGTISEREMVNLACRCRPFMIQVSRGRAPNMTNFLSNAWRDALRSCELMNESIER